MLVSVSFRWNKMANAKEIGEGERTPRADC